ncbi:MAG: MerR family transcriptional regulator [Chitinophagaceae bacterium]
MYNQLDIFGGKAPEQPAKKAEPKQERKSLSTPIPPSIVEEKAPSVSSNLNIPADQELDSKQYYPISDVANMFNVNISLLRFWEKEFSILKPRKNKKGDRLFRPEDIRNLKLIYFLLKEKKYTIKGAKEYLKKGKKADDKFDTVEVLKNIRTMLLELKTGLAQ